MLELGVYGLRVLEKSSGVQNAWNVLEFEYRNPYCVIKICSFVFMVVTSLSCLQTNKYGDPAWTYDNKTQQFYYHSSLSQYPDLNLRNEDVLEELDVS